MLSRHALDRLVIASIAIAAFAAAMAMLIAYARAPEALWRDALHDRNAYLANGMIYAGAWRSFNLPEILLHAARATIWPPLHGLVLGIVLLPWMDYRLGPVVSLAGWWMTVTLAALIARRLSPDRVSGSAAAVLTAVFVMASPAFRLLGADVMLEALGAGLSALALLLYLRAMEAPLDGKRWRWLGFVLTLLFFEKYNYWAMLVLSLAVAFVAEQPRRVAASVRDCSVAIARMRPLRAAIRDPLLIAGLLVAALVAAIAIAKPGPVMLFGKPAGLYPPENLTTLAYALLFIRAALLWRRHRTAFEAHAGPALRMLAYWHLAPVLLSFVIPKRLSGFVWFLSGANSLPGTRSDPLQAALFQWPGFAEGFHVAAWCAVTVIALALIGAARLFRTPTGACAVALFPLVSAAALLTHPQQQWRFEATWLFGIWICAGVGGAMLLQWLTSRLNESMRAAATGAALTAMAAGLALQPLSDMPQRAAIRSPTGPSDMEFAKVFLPLIEGREPIGYLSSFGRSDFFIWSIRSACGCDRKVDAPFNGTTSQQARDNAVAWIAATSSQTILVINAPGVHEMPEIGTTAAIRRDALDVMSQQTRFRHVADAPVPAFGAHISVWRRP